MSFAEFAAIKRHTEELDQLRIEIANLSERVLALEAEREAKSVELDVETLEPKRRGRPPKVAQ